MITVRQDTLRQDGRDVIREVVDHPDSVAIVAMDDRRRVLMIRQYRHPVGRVLCELLDRPVSRRWRRRGENSPKKPASGLPNGHRSLRSIPARA